MDLLVSAVITADSNKLRNARCSVSLGRLPRKSETDLSCDYVVHPRHCRSNSELDSKKVSYLAHAVLEYTLYHLYMGPESRRAIALK